MDASNVEQRTEEWRQAKLGKVSASNIHKVLAGPKERGGVSTTRRNYRTQLALEIIDGKSHEQALPKIYWIEQGIRLEPKARAAYELQTEEMVLTAGFVEHPWIPRFGCSPDALVGDHGLAQIKCPIPAVHWDEHHEAAKIGKVPAKYYAQIQCELACTGRKWSDFVSYNEEFPSDKRLIVIRTERDEPFIKDMESSVLAFNQEVDAMVAELRGEEPSLVEKLTASIQMVKQ
jgi:putative phage-type endonuclease